MLEKIISGGQTGADRAALDVAVKFDIEHGGWIPRGRRTEEGVLPAKYHLVEMASSDYRQRTRQNILDSHGTVILSRGSLTGGSKLTQTVAQGLGRPYCHIDLLTAEEFEAAIVLKSFIRDNEIQILNVAGPRLSHQPMIYQDVKTILELTLYLFFLDTRQDEVIKDTIPMEFSKEKFPQTMEAAVALLCDLLPLKSKIFIAKYDPCQMYMLYFGMLDYIRHCVGFDTRNQALLKACTARIDDPECTIEDAVMEILKQVKHHLEADHLLRVVK